MPQQVRVKGILMHPYSLTPWASADIQCTFHGYTQTPTEQRPSDRFKTTTALDGSWFLDLWTNAEGDYHSHYQFKFPNDDRVKRVTLPAGLPPEIEFSLVYINGTPVTDPEYPSLIALIDERFASGDFSATAEFTQAIASNLWTFNHTLNRRPGIHVTDLAGNALIVETQVTQTQAIVRSEVPITGIVYLS